MTSTASGDVDRVRLVSRVVVAAAGALEQAQDELCRLDAVAGDGDEGFAMATAATGIRERLREHAPASVTDIVKLAAAEFGAVGGAMGALSYVIVTAVADHLDDEKTFTVAQLATVLAAAEDGVSTFGGARRGDKSIVDAIGPARDVAQEAVHDGTTLKSAVASAAAAARAGAEATAAMEARIGRASRLGERSRGAVDAGAQTFALVLSALADAYSAERAEYA